MSVYDSNFIHGNRLGGLVLSRIDRFKGIIPAFYACYDEHGQVSPARVRGLAEFLIGKGVQGLYVCGSSGECIYMTKEERMLVLENVMAVAKGRVTVIAHVAAMSTQESVELAKHAQSCGADALAAVPPFYFSLPEYAIEQYWKAMVTATELPFIIYNIPGTTHYSLSMELFHKMKDCDQVIGVKNSSMPVQDIQKFKAAGGEDFIVFNGPDEQYISGRMIGAEGGIGGTYGVMPELFLAADAAFKQGDNKKALEIQNAINEIIYLMISCQGNLYSVQKEVLRMQGIDIGQARLPLPPFTNEDLPKIRKSAELIEAAKTRFC